MKKTGEIHIDWAISMVIFLVYVIALFVFLRPGVTVEHKPEGLLTLLEKSVKDEIIIDVKETPVYVKKCEAKLAIGGSGESSSMIPSKIIVRDENNKWKIIKISDSAKEYPEYLNNGKVEITCDVPENTINEKEFIITYVLSEKRKTEFDDVSPKMEVILNNDLSVCNAELRATENKYYVFKSWLDNLGSLNYNELKEKFRYPEEREFAIYYELDSGKQKLVTGGENKPVQGNVYIIEWKDRYLDNNYEKGAINVRVESW